MWDLTIYRVVDLHQDTEILWDGPLDDLLAVLLVRPCQEDSLPLDHPIARTCQELGILMNLPVHSHQRVTKVMKGIIPTGLTLARWHQREVDLLYLPHNPIPLAKLRLGDNRLYTHIFKD